MIRSWLRWGVNAWGTTAVAFAVITMLGSLGETGFLMAGVFAALMALIWSPVFIVPAAAVAALLERYWEDRPSGVVLGIIAGLLLTLWTGWPAAIAIGAIGGGTAGWMSDRGLRMLSWRWFAAAGVGGLVAGVAGEVAYRFLTID